MLWQWILPIAVVLIFILRIQFPAAQRAFRSSVFFLSLALILQFQNCSHIEKPVSLVEEGPNSAVIE